MKPRICCALVFGTSFDWSEPASALQGYSQGCARIRKLSARLNASLGKDMQAYASYARIRPLILEIRKRRSRGVQWGGTGLESPSNPPTEMSALREHGVKPLNAA